MTHFRHLAGLAALLFALLVGGCQSGGTSAVRQATDTSPPTSTGSPEYRLGSSDELRITVFGEPELSGDFAVDGTGNLALPLIGTVKALGLTPRDLENEMTRQLGNGYLNNPRVSVEVTSHRPFYILGEVNQPGEYTYSSGLTVMNAVATAQGFTYRANQKVVFIRKAGGAGEQKVQLDAATLVEPGDTIRIVERLF